MRKKECERLRLGRKIGKLKKDLRYCDNHILELTKGKSVYYVNVEGNEINLNIKKWCGTKGI